MRRAIIAAAATVAILVSGTAIALASIPDSHGVIHGCYTVKTGALRVIDTGKGQKCATGQQSLNWNQKGAQGPAGPAGVSGYQVESYTPGDNDNPLGSYTIPCSDCLVQVQLYCPSGKVAISAGLGPAANPGTGDLNPPATYMYPFTDSGGSGYKFGLGYINNGPRVGNLTVYVTCANAS